MRNLVYAINMTADSCCDHTKGIPSDEILDFHANLLRNADVLLFGRITYQLMVPYWPDIAKNHSDTRSTNEFADTFDAVDKIVVVSKSLDRPEGKKTQIIRKDLKDEILKLKQGEGKNILVGGVDIPSQLIRLGLVDEYYFVIQPIIVGEGRRLLEGISLPATLQLKLVESKIFPSGCVALHYLNR
ncbi:MAG TPA: dihydrofolate reductase family protein [Puia sp.]|nr:dihydrofolate reductase family protein [Puia sp.]